jgi:hypothetical protein
MPVQHKSGLIGTGTNPELDIRELDGGGIRARAREQKQQ